jgi:hypothetical protein
MSLADLFGGGDFGFHMRFRTLPIEEFFRNSDSRGHLLQERARWLDSHPEWHAALLPGAEPLVAEAAALAATCGVRAPSSTEQPNEWQRWLELGKAWEPDVLLLKPDSAGELHLLAACVCFPSSWDPSEKMGRPVAFIHEAVPRLNDSIGKQIDTFLRRMRPGQAWMRANWGLSRSAELNLHPSRNLARLDANVTAEEFWLRVEDQALVALPETGGVLFGIRLRIIPLNELNGDAAAREGLRRAIATMPDSVAAYKGILPARNRLLSLLDEP